MRLVGLRTLAQKWLSVPTDKDANAGGKVTSLVGSFLRSFTFGHVRQLDAVATRFLSGLAENSAIVAGIDDYALVDIDDTIIRVHGHQKQGAGFGYSGVCGLNALLATVTTTTAAPMIIGQRLRKRCLRFPERRCSAGRGRSGCGLIRLRSADRRGPVLLRADSAIMPISA